MLSPEQIQIQKLYKEYRHTSNIDRKGLFFSPTCMQICRPVPAYAATSRNGIVRYLKDAEESNNPTKSPTTASEQSSSAMAGKSETLTKAAERIESPPKMRTPGDSKRTEASTAKSSKKARSVYTIRPLHSSEHEFSTNTITASVGFSPTKLRAKAIKERWIGMRVDLWDEGGTSSGILVKVQYWWRFETVKPNESLDGDVDGRGWRQCLHDIMYLGPRDGTEGEQGLEILE